MRKTIAPQHLLQSKTTIADDRLRQAADGFHAFTAKLKKLNVAVKAYHQDTVRAQASRAKLVGALSDVASDSPVSGLMRTGPDQQDGSIVAYANSHKRAVNAVQFSLERYQNEMITYVNEWEKTVSNRISTELKHVESLHKNWAKYDTKVAGLKSASQKKKTKKDIDKIGRNESKLRTARKEYRRNLISLTLLTEEVTERGWKDLVPLMLKMLEFDIETSNESVELMEQLKIVQDEMVSLAQRYEMGDGEIRDGRLRILLEDDALEFVRTEDRRDIESLEPSINTSTPLLSRSHSSSTDSNDISRSPTDVKRLQTIQSTPTTSESDLSPDDKPSASEQPEDKQERPEQPEQPKGAAVRKEIVDIENESVDERGRAIMPTSIYLQFDEDGVQSGIDDLTTLTPYPDRASV